MAPLMATWLLSQLLTHSVLRSLAIPEIYDSSARQIAQEGQQRPAMHAGGNIVAWNRGE